MERKETESAERETLSLDEWETDYRNMERRERSELGGSTRQTVSRLRYGTA